MHLVQNILMTNKFEPEITAFYCIYCGYMAADTAGSMGVQYPANVKFVRLPCTGKDRRTLHFGSVRAGSGWRICRRLPHRQLPSCTW